MRAFIHRLDPLEQGLLLSIKRLRRRPLNFLFLLLTYTGTGQAWFAVAILLNVLNFMGVRFTQDQPKFLIAFFAPFSTWILGMGIKRLVARKRPSTFNDEELPLIRPPVCGSFPSTHTAASVSFFITMIYLGHPITAFVGAWSVLVSFSRIYLGVHYLTDVLGGLVLGVLTGLLISSQYL